MAAVRADAVPVLAQAQVLAQADVVRDLVLAQVLVLALAPVPVRAPEGADRVPAPARVPEDAARARDRRRTDGARESHCRPADEKEGLRCGCLHRPRRGGAGCRCPADGSC